MGEETNIWRAAAYSDACALALRRRSVQARIPTWSTLKAYMTLKVDQVDLGGVYARLTREPATRAS